MKNDWVMSRGGGLVSTSPSYTGGPCNNELEGTWMAGQMGEIFGREHNMVGKYGNQEIKRHDLGGER